MAEGMVQRKGGFYLPNETLPLVSCTAPLAKKSRREKETAQFFLKSHFYRRERERGTIKSRESQQVNTDDDG